MAMADGELDPELSINVTPLQAPVKTPVLSKFKTFKYTDGGDTSHNVSTPHGLINSTGTCMSCNDPHAQDIHLVCFWCDKKFHAVCRDQVDDKMVDKKSDDIICTRSFYNSYKTNIDSLVYQKRPHNFEMLCNPCKTELEIQKSNAKQNRVEVLDKRVDNLSSDVNSLSSDVGDIKRMLENVINENINKLDSTPVPVTTETISTVKKDVLNVWDDPECVRNMKTKATMIIEKAAAGTENKKDVKRVIVQNGIHVDKIFENQSGDTIIQLPTQQHRSNLAAKLHESHLKFKSPDDLLPTISVANMFEEHSRENLNEMIIRSHPEIKSFIDKGAVFSILHIRKQNKNEKFQANIRVSNNIRQFIENIGNRLYIGIQSCKVHDHFYVKRCNKCQKYGHFIGECKAEHPTCAICCSHDHQSKECTSTESPTCNNCKTSKNPSLNQNIHHHASDVNCPSYKLAQNKLKDSILYYNNSKN